MVGNDSRVVGTISPHSLTKIDPEATPPTTNLLPQRGEMLLQQPVDEAIAATDALEDGAFGGVVEEAGVVPGDFAGEV